MEKLKLFFKGLLLIIFYFFINTIIYGIFYNAIYSDNNTLATVSTIFTDLLILLIFIIIYRKSLIPDFYDFKKNGKLYIKNNFKYWVIGLILMVLTNIIVITITGETATTQDLNTSDLLGNPISAIISMVITAPIIEELITRQSFKNVFNNEYIFVLFCGILFGSLHILTATSLLECLYIIPYGVLGCTFAKIYYNTNNIWSSITVHSFHNFLAITLILLVSTL